MSGWPVAAGKAYWDGPLAWQQLMLLNMGKVAQAACCGLRVYT